MRLTATDLDKLRRILERIDQGKADPNVPDRIGRFLRQYKNGRDQINDVLIRNACARREDAAISGENVGEIELHPIAEMRVRRQGFPTGDVAETLVFSDQLGATLSLVLWLKAPHANAAYNILCQNRGLRLAGDYRWTPPTRLTSGEAASVPATNDVSWHSARCLKAVADDLLRPAHALEYIVDYHRGPPGLKFFRCIVVRRHGNEWEVLPAFDEPRRLEVQVTLPTAVPQLHGAAFANLLVYTEPWTRSWTIVDAIRVTPDDALAHVVTWADFRAELDGVDLDSSDVADVGMTLSQFGIELSESFQPNLTRALLPVARQLVRSLRGYR